MNTSNQISLSDKAIDPISGLSVLNQFKCTEQQSEILTACMIGGDDANRAFNQSITLKISGHLNISILEQALSILVARNDSFRMLFDIPNNLCLVTSGHPVKLGKLSLKGPQNISKSLDESKASFASICFDLRNGPLYHFHLLSNDLVHYLSITAHHVICDGWTLGLVINELGELYNGLIHSTESNRVPIQFIDFALAESAYIKSEQFVSVKNYWQDLFKDFKPLPALPYTSARPADYSYKSKHITFPLATEQFNHLRSVADKVNSSLLITMCSVFEVLLYRKSSVPSFVIGLPTAGQPLLNMNHLMGHCVNMIPVLTHVNGQLSFEDYLNQRTKDYKAAFENRRITFGTLLKHLKINRGQSTLPLIPVTFNIDRELIGDSLFEGLQTELEINKRMYSSFDMIINVSRVKSQLVVECDYNSSLFDDHVVNELLEQYQYLIDSLCAQPDILIGNCDLSDPEQIRQSLSEFNDTQADYPTNSNLFELILEASKIQSNKSAIVFEDVTISYGDLIIEIERYSQALIQAGLQPGMRVGVMLDRGIEMMLTLLAVLKTGAAYIPIDPIFPEHRIQYMLEDSKSTLLICEDRFKYICPDNCNALSTLELLSGISQVDLIQTIEKVSNESPAYVIYTSGSTGLPKGVEMSQKSLINLLWSVKQTPGFTSQDALFALTTISFDIAGLELFLPLICGGTLVLAPSDINKDGEAIIGIIEKYDITVLQATPATFRLLQGFGFKGKSNLKLFCGGEPLSLDLATDLLKKCKSLWNLYGPTETCIWSCVKQISSKDLIISVGKPLANTEIYILDSRNRPLTKGQIGEIAIAGHGLAIGYLGRKELTSEKFVSHPYCKDNRIYLTGDLGYINANNDLICLGRTDNQVKIRGYRIETGEIESALIQKGHYREAVVVPKVFGKDDIRLVAFVKDFGLNNRQYKVCKQSGMQLCLLEQDELETLRNALSKDLPDYMLPAVF